ncbi:hypothetical protein [Spiroplasma endosymbiont of Seladonia tumulorum]|uniref:hypothetical protein n=1 Tax=Spiroplasma endosymbiont of Seladonia tumulorum TaxID=3066321 RepID=UPI0030D15D82
MIYKDKEKLQAKFINGFIKNEFYDVIFNYWTLLKNKQINNQKKKEKRTSSKQLADNFVKKLLNNIISLKHEIFNNNKKTFTELEQEKVESKKPENFKEYFYFFQTFKYQRQVKKMFKLLKKASKEYQVLFIKMVLIIRLSVDRSEEIWQWILNRIDWSLALDLVEKNNNSDQFILFAKHFLKEVNNNMIKEWEGKIKNKKLSNDVITSISNFYHTLKNKYNYHISN